MVTQRLKSPSFKEPEGSLPHLQESTVGPYIELGECSRVKEVLLISQSLMYNMIWNETMWPVCSVRLKQRLPLQAVRGLWQRER
jgi:hypothetical protein